MHAGHSEKGGDAASVCLNSLTLDWRQAALHTRPKKLSRDCVLTTTFRLRLPVNSVA